MTEVFESDFSFHLHTEFDLYLPFIRVEIPERRTP